MNEQPKSLGGLIKEKVAGQATWKPHWVMERHDQLIYLRLDGYYGGVDQKPDYGVGMYLGYNGLVADRKDAKTWRADVESPEAAEAEPTKGEKEKQLWSEKDEYGLLPHEHEHAAHRFVASARRMMEEDPPVRAGTQHGFPDHKHKGWRWNLSCETEKSHRRREDLLGLLNTVQDQVTRMGAQTCELSRYDPWGNRWTIRCDRTTPVQKGEPEHLYWI